MIIHDKEKKGYEGKNNFTEWVNVVKNSKENKSSNLNFTICGTSD